MASKQGNMQQAYGLLSNYDNLYRDRYSAPPKYNKFKEKWAMQDVVDSVGYERAKQLLVYYFRVDRPKHPLQWFFYNFDKLDEMLTASEKDAAYREKVREKTRQMVQENSE